MAAVATAVLFSGALGAHPARASSNFLRGPVPVALSNEHGVPGAVAVANDSNLADKVFYSLLVSVPPGYDWSATEFHLVLTRGSVYNADPLAGGTEASPQPVLWSTPAFSPGAYDTFVHSKGLARADLPSPRVGLSPSTPPGREISVAWGNFIGGEDGTFQIAQFTLSADAFGTFSGSTYSTDQPNGPHIFAGIIFPEPSGLACLLLAGLGLLRRQTPRDCRRVTA
jgi:hypothetical protein